MLCSLLLKRPLRTTYLTCSKEYCIDSNNTSILGKKDALKETLEVIDDKQKKQDKSLEEKLIRTFEKKMKNGAYPLFTNFDTYKKWLPVRFINGYYRELYKLPHYTDEYDLDMLVKKLEEGAKEGSRKGVKYFATPPASGKTSAVLPAFLRSAEKEEEGGFTHYIYIAFHNNDKRTFKAFPSKPFDNAVLAYKQGAAFIVNCLKKILNDEKPDFTVKKKYTNMDDKDDQGYLIDIDESDEAKAIKYMDELVAKLSNGGKKPRILFHVDEHRYMCKRVNREDDPGAE